MVASRLQTSIGSRIPFVVGVTGHQSLDPADLGALRLAVDGVFAELQSLLKNTPIVVLSGLAPGADSLCAEVALERGFGIVACLATPAQTFAANFDSAERERFEFLLAAAAEVRVIGTSAAAAYAEVGEYLARYSQIVIALWDGEPGPRPGGTADIVGMRLHGLRSPEHLELLGPEVAEFSDVGPVIRITARRAGRDPLTLAVARDYPARFDGDLTAKRDFDVSIARLARFNTDLARGAASETNAEELQAVVDTICGKLQRRILFVINTLYVLASLAAVVEIVHLSDIWQSAFVAVALVAYLFARGFDFENRYQDYRALSEALRVRDAWVRAGIGDTVETYYLRMHQSELQWIRAALRTIDLLYPVHAGRGAQPHHPGAFDTWFNGQWEYYRRASLREGVRAKRVEIGSRFLFVLGAVALAAALFPKALALARVELAWAPAVEQTGNTLFAIAVALAAFLGDYGEKRGFSLNAKRYERMFFMFDTVKRRLGHIRAGHRGDERKLLSDAGREALVEHADWLLQRRQRPLSFVHR